MHTVDNVLMLSPRWSTNIVAEEQHFVLFTTEQVEYPFLAVHQ